MEVASRENALVGQLRFTLADIVAKIARSGKIEESRDLAPMIRTSLSQAHGEPTRGDRNRACVKPPLSC